MIGKVRFPEGIAYDEDTTFFAAVLADTPVVFTENIVCVYNVNSERSESRFSICPQKTYLDWRRALQPLLGTGLDRNVIKRRQGLLALKIARIHYARRDRAVAAKFVRLALTAPLRLRDRIRAVRYRMMIDKAKTGRRADAATLRPRARPAVPATVSPTRSLRSNLLPRG